MNDIVAVGLRKGWGDTPCYLVSAEKLRRAFLSEAFLRADPRPILEVAYGGKQSPMGHVPTATGYVLFDFSDLTILSYQSAISFTSVPRSVFARMVEEDPASAAVVARLITHRENMGDDLGRHAVGPFNGTDCAAIAEPLSVYETFSTFFFRVPGWTIETGVLSADACREILARIEERVPLRDPEREAWESRIKAAEAAQAAIARLLSAEAV